MSEIDVEYLKKRLSQVQSEKDILEMRLLKVQARCFELLFPDLDIAGDLIKSKMYELINENELLKRENSKLLERLKSSGK